MLSPHRWLGRNPDVLLPLLGAPVAILGISPVEVVLPLGSFIIVITVLLHVLCDVTSVKVASRLTIFILIGGFQQVKFSRIFITIFDG